ncbi:MAG: DNA photolyase family protein [Alphaproteobacteria bacterium]|nr:DNA photolyase family protein [Alphaproteobacteria bacterium]
MAKPISALFWFRQDLRLQDNTALNAALNKGYSIIPVYILDHDNAGPWAMGGASRWWLHESLASLNRALGGRLILKSGRPEKILPTLIGQTGAKAVFWNRCYEPWQIARDKTIKDDLKGRGITVESFKDFLLWEPWEILKDDGTPYKVFTPFYRKGCLGSPLTPLPADPLAHAWKQQLCTSQDGGDLLSGLGLLPKINWHATLAQTWQPGETGAQIRLQEFIQRGLRGYKQDRNRPDFENVSRLSPHLHFGEISIRTLWHTVQNAGRSEGLESDTDHFCSELGWREFSAYLLYHYPDLPRAPLQPRFAHFPWRDDPAALRAWQKGQTGIPIVDAGMRQLWQTGWMHNRVRMIVASFLVKNLLIHWHHGEDWFWDTLVDADLANNSASWQWVAGCGADAAPYFRIFNPVTQGEKFDPRGDYVRQYVPELSALSADEIHAPWTSRHTPAAYPPPLVDLKASRTRALAAFEQIKKAA